MSTTHRPRLGLPRSVARWIALAASVVGLAVSTYLTVEHYDSSVSFACPQTATINCEKVTTSSYSVIAGIPVAVLGLAFFVAMTVLLVLSTRDGLTALLRLVGAVVGVVMVLWLVYVELFEVSAICLWCTAVHALTLVLFASVLWERTDTPARD